MPSANATHSEVPAPPIWVFGFTIRTATAGSCPYKAESDPTMRHMPLRRKLCASSSAKKELGESQEKGEAYSQTPEARLRQPEPVGLSSGAGAKPEQPVCEEAGAFTLGSLQKLKLFALFAQHFHVEVTVGFDPVLVNLDRQRTDQPQGAVLIGKDSDDVGSAF